MTTDKIQSDYRLLVANYYRIRKKSCYLAPSMKITAACRRQNLLPKSQDSINSAVTKTYKLCLKNCYNSNLRVVEGKARAGMGKVTWAGEISSDLTVAITGHQL